MFSFAFLPSSLACDCLRLLGAASAPGASVGPSCTETNFLPLYILRVFLVPFPVIQGRITELRENVRKEKFLEPFMSFLAFNGAPAVARSVPRVQPFSLSLTKKFVYNFAALSTIAGPPGPCAIMSSNMPLRSRDLWIYGPFQVERAIFCFFHLSVLYNLCNC
jgi:hypothetical protein